MRQIKFRIWDGHNVILPRDGAYYQHYVSLCGGIVQKSSEGMDCFGGGDRWSRVDKLEVMQFTGLQDNNGVDIYEGDIVKFKSRFDSAVGCVEYSNESTRFVFNIGSKEKPDYRDVGHGWYGNEIIGNIHLNPELIKL